MSAEQSKAVIRRFFDAWNSRRPEAFEDLITPDVVRPVVRHNLISEPYSASTAARSPRQVRLRLRRAAVPATPRWAVPRVGPNRAARGPAAPAARRHQGVYCCVRVVVTVVCCGGAAIGTIVVDFSVVVVRVVSVGPPPHPATHRVPPRSVAANTSRAPELRVVMISPFHVGASTAFKCGQQRDLLRLAYCVWVVVVVCFVVVIAAAGGGGA
jgi:hypothetical protein